MSNFEKIVKLACKPKNAPPKAKYVDVLVAATYSDDGSLQDICRSLSLRLREPNATVVFKALLTLHQMIRSGSTDALLELLSGSDVLRLKNVSGQSGEGATSSNIGTYASYLDSRIKAYRDLKHDLVSVQTESNRRSTGLGAGSKARRLRHLAVEKGLLREVKQVQVVIESLIKCRFYDDNLQDENTVLAFRMVVKDLLVLFQAGNEGVCNVLEHYFEMSKVDATESFDVYKSFIKQTDRVVDYLSIARKLHNIINVPVPNLKHAPTSLVKALEEYLKDPNFEENRREYKKSLGVVEGNAGARTPSPSKAVPSSAQASTSTPVAAPTAPAGAPQNIQDFFDSIQSDQQPSMFGQSPQHGQPQQMQMMQQQQQMQQPQFNPFRQSMMMPQQTGFMQPQMTGFPMQQPQGFLQPQQTGAMAFAPPPQPGFGLPSQQTGMMQPQQTGFLQPQATGSNPFRQSMMMPSQTGSIGSSGALSQTSSPFGHQAPSAFGQQPSGFGAQIPRPGSTPAFGSASTPKPLQAQTTGSKNPFAPAPGTVPPVPSIPKGPTMNQLASGAFAQQNQNAFGGQQNAFGGQSQASVQPQATGFNNGSSSPWESVNSKPNGGTAMSDLASAFSMGGGESSTPTTTTSNNDFLSQFGSMSMSSNTTGATSPSTISSQPTGFLQPQPTGYGGSSIKPFKPSSNFGSTLMETLPPIPASPAGNLQPQSTGFPGFDPSPSNQNHNPNHSQNPPTSPFGQTQAPSQFGQAQQPAQTGSISQFGGLNSQPTGFQPTSQFGQQALSAQQTGANPFRQSMFGSLNSQPTGMGGPFGGNSPFAGQNPQSAGMFGHQQNGQQSLI
ncbi:hypothetical protein P7C73_g665, partial [Tremellales sp. Uapishka_1]